MVDYWSLKLEALDRMSAAQQTAFAARCAERALAEAEKHCSEEVANTPAIRQAVDLLWRQAIQQDVEYDVEVETIHDDAAQWIPRSEDEPEPDYAIQFASKAAALGMSILGEPQESTKRAAGAGGAMVNLMAGVYEMWNEEQEWQQKALQLLEQHGDRPITRDIFDSLPEYQRKPVSEDYKEEFNK